MILQTIAGLLLAGIFFMAVPALILIERRHFCGTFRRAEIKTNWLADYRQFLETIWQARRTNSADPALIVQIFNLTTAALTVALWLVLPFQLKTTIVGIGWTYLVIAVLILNIIDRIVTGSYANRPLPFFGILKNGLILISSIIPVLFAILITSYATEARNLLDLSRIQQDHWLGFIPHWNIFRSPFLTLTGLSFFLNLVVIMRIGDGSFQPFELQDESEIYSGLQKSFGNFLPFNRQAILFTLAALMVFLFLGGFTDNTQIAPIAGELWFLSKTILIFLVGLWFKYRLPSMTLNQVLILNLKIQVPMLTLIYLGLMIGRWF